MSVVDKRYAEALFAVAVQENAVQDYANNLTAIAGTYESNGEFKDFLLNPQNDLAVKKQVFHNLFDGKIETNLLNFLKLLLDKNRILHLPTISTEFVRLADERNNVLTMTIYTAIPLEKDYIKSICDKFQALYQASDVKATVESDSSLIGGIKVAVGDKLYDASIKGKLSRLQSAMSL
jgi:F-type H+-transporting ATPase subunit delta